MEIEKQAKSWTEDKNIVELKGKDDPQNGDFFQPQWAGQGNTAQMNPGNRPLFGQIWYGKKHITPFGKKHITPFKATAKPQKLKQILHWFQGPHIKRLSIDKSVTLERRIIKANLWGYIFNNVRV